MKLRWFFICICVIGLGIGSFYFVDFINQHHGIGKRLTPGFILLILAAIALQVAAHFMRAYKSKHLLNSVRKTSTGPLFRALAVGFLFNTLLPLRLGEV